MEHVHCIILGAGVSGMACAARATASGAKVMVIDHARKPLRKLLVTGGGKCNITNRNVLPEHYVSGNPSFTRSALTRLTPAQLLRMLEDAGIALEEREEGQLFCKRTSEDVRNWLVAGASAAQFQLGGRIHAVTHEQDMFVVRGEAGEATAPNLVLALGGPAWPQTGASAFGFSLAKQFGHSVVPPRAALVGLHLPKNSPLLGLAGMSLPVTLSLTNPGEKKGLPVAQNLSLLFTHNGVSGPAALQASLYWQQGAELVCNFLPDTAVDALWDAPESGKTLVKNRLRGLLPARLVEALLPPALAEKRIAETSRKDRDLLTSLCTRFPLSPTGNEGFRKAEACAGGVNTHEISSKTMESTKMPGLYVCGELLDVTGRLGGYNLHWALASGFAAGDAIGKR